MPSPIITVLQRFCRILPALVTVVALIGCDQLQNVTSGVGGHSAKSAPSEESTADAGSGGGADETAADEQPDQEAAEEQPIEVAEAEPSKVRLDAFKDFECSSNWTNRDGGLGLKAGTRSGVCTAAFPGQSGLYRVTLMAQLEFDGGPKFRISVDDETIAQGVYPLSKGKLICDCPNWRVNCPDRIVPIDAGVHEIKNGSRIEFFGEEVYPCGDSHGAYAKWRELVFTPAE